MSNDQNHDFTPIEEVIIATAADYTAELINDYEVMVRPWGISLVYHPTNEVVITYQDQATVSVPQLFIDITLHNLQLRGIVYPEHN